MFALALIYCLWLLWVKVYQGLLVSFQKAYFVEKN